MTNKPYHLTVKMSEIKLDPALLDNLASEYYGEVMAVAGPSEDDEITIEFKDESTAPDMIKGLIAALDCFRAST